jgi:hypothetical protein
VDDAAHFIARRPGHESLFSSGSRLAESVQPYIHRGRIGGLPCSSRQVDYLLPIPELQSDWLVIAFSVLDNETMGEKFSQLQVELFDAMMSTFR